MKPLITNLSLREQIVEYLRNEVLCGRLAEGDHLNESELAKRFGVSRTPVRERSSNSRMKDCSTASTISA